MTLLQGDGFLLAQDERVLVGSQVFDESSGFQRELQSLVSHYVRVISNHRLQQTEQCDQLEQVTLRHCCRRSIHTQCFIMILIIISLVEEWDTSVAVDARNDCIMDIYF